MKGSVDRLLHSRIVKHCTPLYLDGHYKHAAAEAMTQVEQAAKEKSGITKMFGVTLMRHVFGEGTGIKLRVPFGEQMQKGARSYFEGTFAYYRNYAHHEGERIDELACLKGLRANNACTPNCHGVEVSSSSHRGIGRAQG